MGNPDKTGYSSNMRNRYMQIIVLPQSVFSLPTSVAASVTTVQTTDLYALDCCLPSGASRAAELAAKVTSAQDVLPTSGLLATAMEMPNIDRILAVNITV